MLSVLFFSPFRPSPYAVDEALDIASISISERLVFCGTQFIHAARGRHDIIPGSKEEIFLDATDTENTHINRSSGHMLSLPEQPCRLRQMNSIDRAM